MNKTKLLLMIAVLCGAPAPSWAQPIEVGASVAAGTVNEFGSEFGGIFGVRGPAAGGYVTLPLNERFAIQPFVTYGRWSERPYRNYGLSGGETDHRDGLFGAVVEQRFNTVRPSLRAFMTYGLAAAYDRRTVAPVVYTSGGITRATPAWTEAHVAEIPISVFGGGIRQAIGRHLAIRAEAQTLGLFIIPLAIRASIGVAVPLGQ